jgi:hypothetical protein
VTSPFRHETIVVDTQCVTVQSEVPAVRREAIGWIATALLCAPAALAALWGVTRLAVGVGPVDGIDLLFLVLWVGTLNGLIPGVILGAISIRRMGRPVALRTGGLLIAAAANVAATMWAWGNPPDVRTSGLVMLAGAALAIVSTERLLAPRQPATQATRQR